MQERRVEGVLRVMAKKESSFEGLRRRESGTRVMRFGALRREAVQGMRRKGSLESEGAMVCFFFVFVLVRVCLLYGKVLLFRFCANYSFEGVLGNCGEGKYLGFSVALRWRLLGKITRTSVEIVRCVQDCIDEFQVLSE